MTNEVEPPRGTFAVEEWSPRDYARRYYPAGRVGRENRALIDGLVSIWHQICRLDVPRDIERLPGNEELDLLVLGGGGTLWDIPSALPHVRGVCYTDPFPSSRLVAEEYLANPDDGYWDAYIAHTLYEESLCSSKELDPGAIPPGPIRERAGMMRSKVVRVAHGDVTARPVVPTCPEGFPFVSAHFVLENLSASKAVWRELMWGASSVVVPGGCLILSSLGMASKWHSRPGGQGGVQPATYLKPLDFEQILSEMGFDLLYLRWIPAAPGEATEDDYQGHIVCAAQKHLT